MESVPLAPETATDWPPFVNSIVPVPVCTELTLTRTLEPVNDTLPPANSPARSVPTVIVEVELTASVPAATATFDAGRLATPSVPLPDFVSRPLSVGAPARESVSPLATSIRPPLEATVIALASDFGLVPSKAMAPPLERLTAPLPRPASPKPIVPAEALIAPVVVTELPVRSMRPDPLLVTVAAPESVPAIVTVAAPVLVTATFSPIVPLRERLLPSVRTAPDPVRLPEKLVASARLNARSVPAASERSPVSVPLVPPSPTWSVPAVTLAWPPASAPVATSVPGPAFVRPLVAVMSEPIVVVPAAVLIVFTAAFAPPSAIAPPVSV